MKITLMSSPTVTCIYKNIGQQNLIRILLDMLAKPLEKKSFEISVQNLNGPNNSKTYVSTIKVFKFFVFDHVPSNTTK